MPFKVALEERAQGEILARLFLNADRSFTIAELARAAKAPYASAHREVSRIIQMGLASTEKRGQFVEMRVRADAPASRRLAELLALTYGPAVVIPQHLTGISGIDQAFIYGPGPPAAPGSRVTFRQTSTCSSSGTRPVAHATRRHASRAPVLDVR
ncbi:hypothetical protein [Cryobacterium gelidum]|uniref:Uncharacterized protein n=1 Tax=Cryobacterium gelidum TaxID=1259164 RepID=A0A4V3IUG1_9MICO|nr:hypothetical protein [Cryobacterium gelidum]TFD72689.1 hypothetical protein E3T50_05050 [Cryobacterium gelidum]